MNLRANRTSSNSQIISYCFQFSKEFSHRHWTCYMIIKHHLEVNLLAKVSYPNCYSRLVQSSSEVLEFTTRLRISRFIEDSIQLSNIWSFLFQVVNGGFVWVSISEFSDSFWFGAIKMIFKTICTHWRENLRFPDCVVWSIELNR